MRSIPENLKYTASHEWVLMDGDTAKVGITDFAQHKLGDIVFVNLPGAGEAVEAGERATDIESVKAVADIYSPFTGAISAANDALDGAPEMINDAPYEAWIFEVSGITASEELMDAAAYAALCEAEGE